MCIFYSPQPSTSTFVAYYILLYFIIAQEHSIRILWQYRERQIRAFLVCREHQFRAFGPEIFSQKKLLSGKFWIFAPLPPAPSTKIKLSEGRQEGPSLINFHSHRLHYWVCVGAHWCYLRAGTDRTTGLRRGLYPRPNEPFLRRCYRRPPRMRNSGRGGRTCFLRAGRAVLCLSATGI